MSNTIRLLACLLLLPLAACGNDETILVDGGDPNGGDEALLRVVHATRDAPELQMTVTRIDEEMEVEIYSQALPAGGQSDPIAAEPGLLRLYLARATAPDMTLLEAEFELAEGERRSLAVIGSLNADALGIASIAEPVESAGADEADVHFLNAVHVDGNNWPVTLSASGEDIVSGADFGVWQPAVAVTAGSGSSYSLVARNSDGLNITPPVGFTPDATRHYLVIAAGVWGDGVQTTDPVLRVVAAMND
ncbi:DUF4397 domain-containing protein [Natronospira bacteriovora]|uniref:DUF4397 domain-containing protein n=1 Tax=Natronospira bacteriovora TaxID=3069753 RepID=A0ABU0W9U0_9GAMM|nr:DUF4397 domain-containing protein [Natronospira sp. AB-CW4]MDQ2070801.1 hypothetical protein [Natronospira sp. AB-CW4]